ncbi:DNA primase family protein [Mycolicibacterium xanthum]|uniref:DNA primase family protein n=1 Tax=Mycolicibacterium xanthum TaxID=2796469 RepID=UPI00210213F6|nr:phage/plasmid primase, P4 family [Mycolicibacterium xanthum]
MAYRLAASHRDRLLHVHGIGWYHWDGTRWAVDEIGAAKRAVLDVLRAALAGALGDRQLQRDIRACESNSGVVGVLGIASALTEFAATVADLDADPYLLNAANGTVDLHTLRVRAHDPADRITKVCNGGYSSEQTAEQWEGFLSRILPDSQVRGFVQRLLGLALLGEVREHLLPICTGVGANGKSTFWNAVLHTLGDYAATAEPDLFMHREGAHPTGEMDLMGRRLVVVSETDEGRRLAEATMKRLTGGDRIKARRMRQDFVEFTPAHLPVLVTNHLPLVSGDSPAIWRRLRVVPFDTVIPDDEQDDTLPGKLELEADGILSWAIAGLRGYLDGGLAEPDAVRARTDDYQRRSDTVGRFIADRCVCAPTVKATTTQLYEEWQRWAKAEGCDDIGRGNFGEVLDRRGYPAAKPSHGNRWRHGICVLASEDTPDEDR